MKNTLPPDELPRPPDAGDGPKVFVSYARADSHLVYPEIRRLQDEGFALWYDWADVPAGHDWQEVTDRENRTCSCFLVFVTPASLRSNYVSDEITKALEAGRPFVCVHWRNLELPAKVRSRAKKFQAIHRYALHTSDYEARLRRALVEFAGEPRKPHAPPSREHATPHEARPSSSTPWLIVCGLLLLLCAGSALLGVSVVAAFAARTPEPNDLPHLYLFASLMALALFGLAAVLLGAALAVYLKQLRGKSR